jgi:hypothetical protein
MLISDGALQFDTQDVCYAEHASRLCIRLPALSDKGNISTDRIARPASTRPGGYRIFGESP